MSSDQVIVHYILHSNNKSNKDFVIDSVTNQIFSTDKKVQILGKFNKKTLLSDIRKKFTWKEDEVLFMTKSYAKKNQVFIFDKNKEFQQKNNLDERFQVINTVGQQTIKLMEIFDYSITVKVMTEQTDNSKKLNQIYLIHLCVSGDYHQSSIVKKINKARQQININNSTTLNKTGITLVSNNKFDQVSTQLENKINNLISQGQAKIKTLTDEQQDPKKQITIPDNSINTKVSPSSTILNPTNSSNPTKPSQKTIINEKTTIITPSDKTTVQPVQDTSKTVDNLIKKVLKVTTKEQMQSTLLFAKATHRSFHKGEQIKQRSIIDFQNSRIELINAYKNFFYEREVIVKDQTQAKQLKESLNSLEFNLDVGAPSAALDSKIGMALLRTNSTFQQNYLHNESFSQVHIAYSFEEAFQIEPQNIMLKNNLKNSFKTIFMRYLIQAKRQGKQNTKFFQKRINQIQQISQDLQQFFSQYGSELQCGVFVFGGKYLAQTSFKFLTNLDIKSKEKVRSMQGKFTLQGGYVNVNPGFKETNKQTSEEHNVNQDAIISRSYILFPGSSKNLTEWNIALDSSRQDWKLVLKDIKKIFIGDILSNRLNSEEYNLIDEQVFSKFMVKVKSHFYDFSNFNKNSQKKDLEKYKKQRLFVLWKEDIIKNIRVIKLTPIKKFKPNKNYQNNIKHKQQPVSARKMITQQRIQTEDTLKNENSSEVLQKESCCYRIGLLRKQQSFYILLRNKEIDEAYSTLLKDQSEYQQKRQIYDSPFQKCFFKYFCCCLFQKKVPLTQIEIKRKKYAKYFSDSHNSNIINRSDLDIYNMEIQHSFNAKKFKAEKMLTKSTIISASPRIKHIFDITEQNLQDGVIQSLIFKTTQRVDLFNRSYRYQIEASAQFLNMKKGFLNMLEKSQQEEVILKIKNIRKVNLLGEVIQDKVHKYENLFVNDLEIQHYMFIEKLANVSK